MFNIAICEDVEFYYKKHKEVTDRVFTENSLDYKIDYYPSGEELIAACQENKYDIVIMDYEFKGSMNGIETSQKLRELDKNVFLIFISNYTDPAIPAIDVSTIKYIDKSNPKYAELLTETLLKCIGWIQEREALFQDVLLREIIYLEGNDNDVIIYTKDDKSIYRGNLNDAEKRLKNYWFQRSHKSYLINCKFVRTIIKSEALLFNGERLPIGRKYMQDFKSNCAQFLLRRL